MIINERQKIKLKKYSEINFNLYTGAYHLSFDNTKEKLGNGNKKFIIANGYYFGGNTKIFLEDLKGNKIRNIYGDIESFPLSFFKKI